VGNFGSAECLHGTYGRLKVYLGQAKAAVVREAIEDLGAHGVDPWYQVWIKELFAPG
jgi:hypothetical protein